MIGQQLAHFRLIYKIGEGGMGVVYKAHDERLDRDVAIKVLPAESLGDPASRSQLLREARIASKLNHPNICTIHEVGEAEGQAFIAMELVEGQPVSALVMGGALPGDQVLRYALHMADALAHAHERGVVHRDFKSANVVITPEGRAKVLDFGLARRLTADGLAEIKTLTQNTLTMPGLVAGTLAYMAPEQLRGQPADERSDIWALGVVLYEMAAGIRPFQGDTGFELSSSILNETPPPLPTGRRGGPPVLFRSVIERCLEKDPRRRYQKAGEVRAALEAVQTSAGLPILPALRYALKRRWKLVLATLLTTAVAAVVVLDVGGLRSRLLSLVPATSFRSLAVLPVENLSGNPEQEYFTDGMTAALIADLSKIGALRVIAQSSVMRYKNAHKPLKEIARELNVEAVLESSVLREADRVRVTAQLGEAMTERNLWAESFERESSSILAVQAEVVQHVAKAVRVKLKSQEKARLSAARKVNPEVYELYLKGMYHMNKFTPEDFQKGLAYFSQAVEKDPADALGYAGLAIGYELNAHENPEAREDSLNKAKAAAATALRLNDSLAEVQAAMGFAKDYLEWQWEEAFGYFNRALEINPNMAEVYLHRGWLHVLFGRTEEALKDHMRVKQTDPFNGLNLGWLAELYRMQGRHDEAEAEALKCIEVEPTLFLGHYILGLIYQDRGNHEKAIEAIRKAAELSGMQWLLGPTYIKAGKIEEARKMLEEMNKMKPGPWLAFFKAQIYTSLGENDEAFRWLRFEPHCPWVPWVRVLDWFEPLKKDPRFPDLLRHMNLPPL